MKESLTQSLFGTSATTNNSNLLEQDSKTLETNTNTTNNDNNLPLSRLFDSSSTLPERPQNVNFSASRSTDNTNNNTKESQSKAKRKTNNDDNDDDDNRRRRNNSDTDGDQRRVRQRSSDTDPDEGRKSREDEELTVFVGNLPKDITRKGLAAIFRPTCKVKSVRLRSVATAGVKVAPEYAGNQNLVKKVSVNTNKLLADAPKKTAQGYVVLETSESVQAALLLDNTLLPGRTDGLRLRIDHATPTIDSTRSVFVGNLKYGADETTLRNHFITGCGWDGSDEDDDMKDVVVAVRLIRDKETMQCKGFGYVLLKDKSYVSQALKMMHDSEYMNRTIRVMVCGKRFKGKRGVAGDSGDGGDGNTNGRRGGKGGGTKTKPRWKQQDKDKRAASKTTVTQRGTVAGTIPTVMASKRKKRGAKKTTGPVKAAAGRTNGISKRAATGKKREKRINKLQKRMTTGMGKNKKA